MLQVPLSDLKLIGTVPAVINGGGNELIFVLGSNCMQHRLQARVGRPTAIPYGLCIHLMKCKVIGCPVQCCPINHEWVKCLRLLSVNLKGSPGVWVWTRRGSDGIWAYQAQREPPLPPSKLLSLQVHHGLSLFDFTAWANNCVCLWCTFLTASQNVKRQKKLKNKSAAGHFFCSYEPEWENMGGHLSR